MKLISVAFLIATSAFAQNLTITSPRNYEVIHHESVHFIVEGMQLPSKYHIELRDNDNLFAVVYANELDLSYELSNGWHHLTVLAIDNNTGGVIDYATSYYKVEKHKDSK